MSRLYKYLFCKLYYIYIEYYGSKDYPYLWASIIMSSIISINISIIFDIIEYNLLPQEFNFYSNNYYYFVTIVLASVLFYNQHNDRYKSFLNFYNSLTRIPKRRLRIISNVYVVLSIVAFFYMGYLIRQYNLK
jgi:drug/metabolite transporter (DMT)-like permease